MWVYSDTAKITNATEMNNLIIPTTYLCDNLWCWSCHCSIRLVGVIVNGRYFRCCFPTPETMLMTWERVSSKVSSSISEVTMTWLIYPSSRPYQIIVGTDGDGKYLEMIRVAKHFWVMRDLHYYSEPTKCGEVLITKFHAQKVI